MTVFACHVSSPSETRPGRVRPLTNIARATLSLSKGGGHGAARVRTAPPHPRRAQLYMVESTLPTCALPTGMPFESSASPSTSQPPAEPKLTQ